MTVEDVINMAVGQGADLFTIWQWTWGETLDYIKARKEARRMQLQDEAALQFRTANVLARMVAGNRGEKFTLMKEYPFLWTEEERKRQKISSIIESFNNANERIRARKKAKQEHDGEGQ